MRIAGVQIPDDKHIAIAMTYIYGIGRPLAREILDELKINPTIKSKELKEEEQYRIQEYIRERLRIEGDLRREIQYNIKRLQELNSWRGSRHRRNLPARGQRTKTNARTKRGKRVTMGSGRVKEEKT